MATDDLVKIICFQVDCGGVVIGVKNIRGSGPDRKYYSCCNQCKAKFPPVQRIVSYRRTSF